MHIQRVFTELILLTCCLFSAIGIHAGNPGKSMLSRQRVILDTDIDSDVDDVGALAMLLNLHKEGCVNLLGVITTSDDPYAPVCESSINNWYGYPDLPVGFNMGQPSLVNHSRYTQFIANEFPPKISSWHEAAESTTLYRRLLDQSPDGSVTLITIGHLSSLQKLLQSPGDQISALDGVALFRKKIKRWICMGGQFPNGKEANFSRPDPLSTIYCINHCDKEIIFCGWEVGNKVITGGINLRNRLNPHHPVYRAYELYNHFAGRQSWDQIAILQLTAKADQLFSYSTNGCCLVTPDGSNQWTTMKCGNQRYVILKPSVNWSEVVSAVEGLIY